MKSVKVAYVFLIILLAALGFFTYLKFTYVDDKDNQVDNTQYNSVALSSIVNSYNSGNYNEKTNASIENTTLNITYDNLIYAFSFENGVLKYTQSINDINSSNINNVFLYLVDAVNVVKGGQLKDSFLTTNLIINGIYSNNAIKFIKGSDIYTYVIDTNKDNTLYKADNIYNELKVLNMNDKNYNVEINDIKLIAPFVKYDSYNNTYNIVGYIVNDKKKNATIVISFYNKDKKKVLESDASIGKKDYLLDSVIKLGGNKNEDIVYCSYDIK